MTTVPTMPGLDYQVRPPRAAPSPLRSDVAGFVGRTRRGPVGKAVRVEGWRGFSREFGGLVEAFSFPYAVRGYFENGGQVAHIVRVVPDDPRTAGVVWGIGQSQEGQRGEGTGSQGTWPTAAEFPAARYRFTASSPGRWGESIRIEIVYLLSGPTGQPVVDVTVRHPEEPTEHIRSLDPSAAAEDETIEERISRQSSLVRLERLPPETDGAATSEQATREEDDGPQPSEPTRLTWHLEMKLPDDGAPGADQPDSTTEILNQYRLGLKALGDQPEVALAALCGLYEDLPALPQQLSLIREMADQAAALQDRLVLVDLPPILEESSEPLGAAEIPEFVEKIRDELVITAVRRAVAVYHPWLRVQDPLGGAARPQRRVPPSGHVAGVISRVDRDRGAHHTPANVPLTDAVDVETAFDRRQGGLLNELGVNLIRCVPGRGLMVWGGRTLERDREGRYLAVRRFVHRLVRAIRRVAEPNVFEVNAPDLWMTLVRAVTTVLLEAFRGGALKGERPEEGFRVRCDAATNPPHQRDEGRVVCEIDVAPVAPMEFITLRVAVSETGEVEVFEP